MFSLLKRKQNRGVFAKGILLVSMLAFILLSGVRAQAAVNPYGAPAEPLGYGEEGEEGGGGNFTVDPFENAYLVNINTGSNAGKSVEAIRIRYYGAKTKQYDYAIINPKTDFGKSIMALSRQQGTLGIEGLTRDSANVYLLQPIHEVEYIDRVEVILKGSGTWTCNGVSIIKPDEIKSIDRRFENDGSVFVHCSGTVVMRMQTQSTSDGFQSLTVSHSSSELRELPMIKVNEPYETTASGSFVFRMDMADVFQGGLESVQEFEKDKSILSNFKDVGLNVVVRYKDTSGSVRALKFPIVSSIVSYAKSKGISTNEPIAGLIAQGGTTAFGLELPDYSSFIDYTLDFQNTTVANDTFNVIGMSLYDAEAVEVKVAAEGGFLNYTFNGDPEYYFKAGSITGTTISPGQIVTFGADQILPYEAGVSLLPKESREMYLVEIKTDTVLGSAATSDAKVDINYLQQNGKMGAARELSLVKEIGDYYGYNAAKWLKEDDPHTVSTDMFEYYYHTSEGGALRFYVDLPNVKQFKNITVKLGAATDTWQIASVTIYSVSSYGKRSVIWGSKDTMSVGRAGFYACRDYTRSRSGTINTVASSAESVLIQNGQTVTIPFDSSEIISDDEEVFERGNEGVSYDEICKEYGFTKRRSSYVVEVDVANDSLTDYNMGDCGSENYFYFQLLFKNGQKSPIVLANQQITGDAFRAGETASFIINTNRDFGEVEAVRIIPDDSATKSEIFDKLKINNIRVTQQSTSGAKTTWCFDNIGWIDIDYHDEGEQTVGRSLDELARDFDRTDKTFSVTLEFAVMTNVNIDGAQEFSGNVQAEIAYVDKSKRQHVVPVDITQLMYIYNDNATFKKDPTTSEIISDTSQMFRPGKMDRFEVSFPNIDSLSSIKFNVRSNQDGMEWTIGSVNVSQVQAGGVVRLNEKGEYQKTSELKELCSNQTNLPESMQNLSSTNRQTFTVGFQGNKIDIDDTESEIHSKTPISQNDHVNVYVAMKEGATPTTSSEKPYALQAEIEYTTVNGKFMSSLATLTPSDDGRSAYISGMSASCMNAITAVHVYAVGGADINAAVDSVAIEQYRMDSQNLYNQVVCEYYVNMEGGNAAATGGVTGTPSIQTLGNDTEKVYLGIAHTDDVVKLIPEEKDVTARVLYQSTCAPYGDVFVTEAVALSSQNVKEISTGKTVALEFNKNLVDHIVGVELRSVGGFNLSVDAVYANLFETTKGVTLLKNTTTLIHERVVGAVPATWTVNADRGAVTPIEIAFTTSNAQGSASGNGNNPVRLKVTYVDSSGAEMDRVYDDIRLALDTAGDFYAGQKQTARLLIPEAVSVTGFTIEPYDNDDEKIASWKVDRIDLAFMKDGDFIYTDSRLIDKFIFEEEPYPISTDPVIVMADIEILGAAVSTTERVANDKVSYILNDGTKFQFTMVKTNGMERAYTITTEQVTMDNSKVSAEDGLLERTGDNTYVFTPPVKDSKCYYRITVESTLAKDAKIIFILEVPGKESKGGDVTDPTAVPPTNTEPTNTEPTKDSSSESASSETQPSTEATKESETETQPVETEVPTESAPEETEAP